MALPITLKTPGVYINERSAFPNSVVGVETAIPAFIGYTEKSRYGSQSLHNKPTRVDSFMEFVQFYGGGPKTKFNLIEVPKVSDSPKNYDTYIGEKGYKIKAINDFKLYDSMKLFYQNGGGSCFVVSVGTYTSIDNEDKIIDTVPSKKLLAAGIVLLEKETVPTMLVIPDAILLKNTDCYSLQQSMLMHCGKLMNRIAILDIYDGDKPLKDETKPVDNFRNNVSSDSLSYGAAYYPWLNTTVSESNDVNYKSLNDASAQILQNICLNSTVVKELSDETVKGELLNYINILTQPPLTIEQKEAQDNLKEAESIKPKDQGKIDTANAAIETAKANAEGAYEKAENDPKKAEEDAVKTMENAEKALVTAIAGLDTAQKADPIVEADVNTAEGKVADAKKAIKKAKEAMNIAKGIPTSKTVNRVLATAIGEYKLMMDALLEKKNLLPPSAAMAGIFSLVDAQRGVWKAPANVAMSSVVSPAVLIDYQQQEDLNAPILGKAICAIRPFIGLGTMVWGARTLDANSLDWRYINVRRTMIMMEQSIKFAAKAYVFEPNVKNTWVSVKAMISNFLTNLWKLGALAGSVPEDAFSVNVGLGTTMTAVDILEGKMIIEVKVAVSRPAEFIVIHFEQQMQKS